MSERRPTPERVDGMLISYPADWRTIPEKNWRSMRTTPEAYQRMRELRIERERSTPAVGDPAPDFELPMLVDGSPDRSQTQRLSSLVGRPVGLVFGSYT